MRFLKFLERRPYAPGAMRADDILWGVRRRPGFSEIDDPAAHRGVTQHAFIVGFDQVALCGYEPDRWRHKRLIPLAVATDENPPCLACRAAIRESSFAPAALPVMIAEPQAVAIEIFPEVEFPVEVPAFAPAPPVAARARTGNRRARRPVAAVQGTTLVDDEPAS